jgi:hypothetical protein
VLSQAVGAQQGGAAEGLVTILAHKLPFWTHVPSVGCELGNKIRQNQQLKGEKYYINIINAKNKAQVLVPYNYLKKKCQATFNTKPTSEKTRKLSLQ